MSNFHALQYLKIPSIVALFYAELATFALCVAYI